MDCVNYQLDWAGKQKTNLDCQIFDSPLSKCFICQEFRKYIGYIF